MAIATKPSVHPHNPLFSSGPCAKRPGWSLDALRGAFIHFHQFDAWMGPTALGAMAVLFFALALRGFSKA